MDALPDGIPESDSTSNSIDDRSLEQEPGFLLLDEQGVIIDSSRAGARLFGFRRNELKGQHIARLFSQLSEYQLFNNRRFNAHLEFLCHCGFKFRAVNRQGNVFNCELHFVLLAYGLMQTIKLIVLPSLGAE